MFVMGCVPVAIAALVDDPARSVGLSNSALFVTLVAIPITGGLILSDDAPAPR
jgi:hypothetical protein